MKSGDWMAGVTLGIALVGAVLGVINTWRNTVRDRVRLRVVPQWVIYGGGESVLSIEITNLSFFDVTVTGAGFSLRRKKGVLWVLPPVLLRGGFLPQRMEPRTTVTVLLREGTEDHESFADVDKALATTACGCTFKGTSPALRGQIQKARAAASAKN